MQVDVEGCELQVLQGIQSCHWPHIKQVTLLLYCLNMPLCAAHAPLHLQGKQCHCWLARQELGSYLLNAASVGTCSGLDCAVHQGFEAQDDNM